MTHACNSVRLDYDEFFLGGYSYYLVDGVYQFVSFCLLLEDFRARLGIITSDA